MDFSAISDCDTSQYHSQGGATELALCALRHDCNKGVTSLPVDAVHCPPDFPDSVHSRFLNADYSRTARLWAEMLGLWPGKAGQLDSYLSSHVIWVFLFLFLDHWLSVCAGWDCWNGWESTCLECVRCSCRRYHPVSYTHLTLPTKRIV